MVIEKLKDMGIGFHTGREAFDETRPTLVMIHGAGGQALVWKSQTYLLSHDINALALDLPGHGHTPGNGVSDLSEYAWWLGRVLDELFDQPVFLMGHSMGGAVVIQAALSYPQKLAGIILAGTGARLRVAPAFLEGFTDRFEQTIDSVMGFAYASGTDPALIAEGAKMMKSAGKEIVFSDFSACDRFDSREQIASINLPCLIICGAEDKLTPPSLSRKLNDALKDSELVILPSAGHHVMIEVHRAFNRHIKDFIAKHSIQ